VDVIIVGSGPGPHLLSPTGEEPTCNPLTPQLRPRAQLSAAQPPYTERTCSRPPPFRPTRAVLGQLTSEGP